MQVEMELLAEEDGWKVLSSLSQQDLLLVAPAVWDALAKVHRMSLPSGGSPVLADCRPCNVMVKTVGGFPEVRFIDFDWAGRAGDVCYPPFMNHREGVWPPNVQEFAPALQRHDKGLLVMPLQTSPYAWFPICHVQAVQCSMATQASLAAFAHDVFVFQHVSTHKNCLKSNRFGTCLQAASNSMYRILCIIELV